MSRFFRDKMNMSKRIVSDKKAYEIIAKNKELEQKVQNLENQLRKNKLNKLEKARNKFEYEIFDMVIGQMQRLKQREFIDWVVEEMDKRKGLLKN